MFGNSMLFSCYEFMAQMGQKPKSFVELFEFMNYVDAKNTIQAAAMQLAKSKAATAGAV
jgi:hypothetical protein